MNLRWVAYCVDCKKILDTANNGVFVEVAAKNHKRGTKHSVIVGYYVK